MGVASSSFRAPENGDRHHFRPLRGESDRGGTVAVGKRSDLLLVDGNPVADVAAAAKIAGVLVRGRWLGAEEIAATLRAIEAPSADEPQPTR